MGPPSLPKEVYTRAVLPTGALHDDPKVHNLAPPDAAVHHMDEIDRNPTLKVTPGT